MPRVKRKYRFKKGNVLLIVLVSAIILATIVAGFIFAYYYVRFLGRSANNYSILNNYYGFRLQAPLGWRGQENAVYSNEHISQILSECQKSKTGLAYEIGDFKFESQKYPQNFWDLKTFPEGLKSGAILEITVNCLPVGSLPSVKTGPLSYLHNGLNYNLKENIYISSADASNDVSIKDDFTQTLNKIIASLQFTK